MDNHIISIQDYLNKIDRLRETNRALQTKSSDFYLLFRGLDDEKFSLLPSVFRKDERQQNIYPEEDIHILEYFLREAASLIPHISMSNKIQLMTYAQHFGVPTRLLDFSTNPLVALYFCCRSNYSSDGAVYLLFDMNYCRVLLKRDPYWISNSSVLTPKMVRNDILEYTTDKSHDCSKHPCHVVPQYIDPRMSAQSSRFLLWGSDRRPLEEQIESGDYLQDHHMGDGITGVSYDEQFIYKFIISSSKKQTLLNQLAQCGISEKSLFPGLDGIGAYVKAQVKLDNTTFMKYFMGDY